MKVHTSDTNKSACAVNQRAEAFDPTPASWTSVTMGHRCCSSGVDKRVVQKGGFGGCSPGTKTGMRVHSDVPPERKTGTKVRSHVPAERKPERGYIRENHPFTRVRQKGSFAKGVFSEKSIFRDSREFRDSRDFREPPDCGKQRRIRPFSRASRESRDFRDSRDFSTAFVMTPFSGPDLRIFPSE